MPRKLWLLLAFGGLTYEVEHRRLDLDELRQESEAVGGTLGGLDAAEALIWAASGMCRQLWLIWPPSFGHGRRCPGGCVPV
jgi:hypothetical protein